MVMLLEQIIHVYLLYSDDVIVTNCSRLAVLDQMRGTQHVSANRAAKEQISQSYLIIFVALYFILPLLLQYLCSYLFMYSGHSLL